MTDSESQPMSTRSIRLLTLGRFRRIALKLEAALPSHLTFPAVIDQDHYSIDHLETVLASLNPLPDGVLVGSGMPVEVVEEVRVWLEQWNEIRQVEHSGPEPPERNTVKFLTIEHGSMSTHGFDGTVQLVLDEVNKTFG